MANHKRIFVYLFLFSLLVINYLDRVTLSIAGNSIAGEMHLTPVALGYLFSSFLWIYVICLLPAGSMTDRLGARRAVAFGVGLWSICQILGGFAQSAAVLLSTRLGLGVFESPTNASANLTIREWAPKTERGLASALFISGSFAGPALGAPAVAWLVSSYGWRPSFIITGMVGLVWVLVWILFFRKPEDARWLSPAEREKILSERDVVAIAVNEPGIGYRRLLTSRTIWVLAFTQGCMTYTQYLFLTWLPGYLQSAYNLTIMRSGFYTALPYAGAVILCLFLSHLSDNVVKQHDQAGGFRRFAVSVAMILSAAVLLSPLFATVGPILVLMTISLTFSACGMSWNFALANDLLRTPGDVGRIFAFMTLGGNCFGILAPIITGYLVSATGRFDLAFLIAGILALAGAVVSIAAREPIGAPRETVEALSS